MQRRFLLGALAALFMVTPVVVIVLLPQLLDWNRYRDTIAEAASERLGRHVTIAGPVSLTLWPAPELTAEQVAVGGDGRGAAGTFQVAALRLRVGLRALISGRIEARTLVLRGVDLRLPWPLPQSVLVSRPPHWLGPFTAQVEGGTLRLGDLTLTAIDATLSQTEDGTLTAAGDARLGARVGQFTFRLGRPDADGVAALDASLDGRDGLAGTGASFTGTVASDGSFGGRMQARGTNLSSLMAAPALPFRAEGRLTVGDGLAALDEATFDVGGTPASGALALRLSPIARLDVALSATRLDLDPWAAAWLPANSKTLTRPTFPVGLDLAIEAAQLSGGTLQRVRARADSEGDTVRLSEVSATLPGDARLEFDGRTEATASADPNLVGTLRLDAPALRTTLRWLNDAGMAKLPLPSNGILRSISFTTALQAAPGSIVLNSLTGRVDSSTLTGSLRLADRTHGGIAVDVTTDRLALDPWLQTIDLPTQPARWMERGGLPALSAGDVTRIAVRAQKASLHGLTIDGLTLDLAAAPSGQVTLRQLEGTALGLHLDAAGTFSGDGSVTGAKLSLNGPSGRPLAALAPSGFATPSLWDGPVSLAIAGSGPPSALALQIKLGLGDAQLDAQPTIDLTNGSWRAAATLHHPGATRLLAMLGLPVTAEMTGAENWPGEGSLSLVGRFSGTAAGSGEVGLSADQFILTAGSLRASGQLSLRGRMIEGSISADVLPLPLPEPTSQVPLPIALLRGWGGTVHVQADQIVTNLIPLVDHAALTVTLNDDALRVDALVGRVANGTLSAGATLNISASPPILTAAATLHDATITGAPDDEPLGLLSGHLDATADLTASGYSPAAMLATLSGRIHLAARDGALAGFDLFGAARAIDTADTHVPTETEQYLRAALQTGTTSFARLDISGEAASGLLRLKAAQFQGPAGRAEAQGSIGLTDGTMDIRIVLAPSVPDSPMVGLRLDGLLTAPDRQPELAAAARWLAERPATR